MRLLRCGHTHHRNTVPPNFLACEMAESTRDLAIYPKESVVHGHHAFKRKRSSIEGMCLKDMRLIYCSQEREYPMHLRKSMRLFTYLLTRFCGILNTVT